MKYKKENIEVLYIHDNNYEYIHIFTYISEFLQKFRNALKKEKILKWYKMKSNSQKWIFKIPSKIK